MCMVANTYGLNPILKEVYAFPAKGGQVVPIVGVDGWIKMMNSCPEFDGIEFDETDESCTAIIHRKDRSHPIKATEWLAECAGSTEPWKRWPRRMLRHKAMIQCARIAFGFSGIYDEDEARRIASVAAEAVEQDEPPRKKANSDKLRKALGVVTTQEAQKRPQEREDEPVGTDAPEPHAEAPAAVEPQDADILNLI